MAKNRCCICYEKFTKENCTCNLCKSYIQNPEKEYFNEEYNTHLLKKKKYSFKCDTCSYRCCRSCINKMEKVEKNGVIKCPMCRQFAIKEYVKIYIVPEINTLFLCQNQRLTSFNKYVSTWKKGYWNDVGLPIIRKIFK